MKAIATILILLTSATLSSQSNTIAGVYSREAGDKEKHFIEYTLNLDQDGTFSFHSFTDQLTTGIPSKVHKYGKGSWNTDGKIVSFFCDKETDLDEKHTLDFSNSLARFITKSPRDISGRIIKTRLQFFESEIFWIERLAIFKK